VTNALRVRAINGNREGREMPPVNQPLGIDQCNCFAMRKASRQMSRFYNAHLEPTGLRITQFLTLAAIPGQESPPGEQLRQYHDMLKVHRP